MIARGLALGLEFQSTLPVRGATAEIRGLPAEGWISIHAPREGSDYLHYIPILCDGAISIHAPREGSDWPASGYPPAFVYFNPRSP